jgi:hypothetical protein
MRYECIRFLSTFDFEEERSRVFGRRPIGGIHDE